MKFPTDHLANDSRLDRVFGRLLLNHPYGWALYKKTSARDVKPGSCGYFDSTGDWCSIVQLAEFGAVEMKSLGSFDEQLDVRSGLDPRTWGPKESAFACGVSLGGSVDSS
jgi:hypothetical protein